ncbi:MULTISPECIES: mammalian cell entry protein [Mycolicibacterium]|uniref:Mammalian cell entry protein n=1 Tax=Mycolicibacterium bacteremicum TaxID=564198 RepID=A0A1W9YWF3_MYCBA|nr:MULTISPECIES: mammalian cell entry protein [Mycolicibacterium]MCV7430434.1 mammalian cell entry protein [Mycolicibacterium bacteremicum]ORA04262.1 mammalian cell entry protein [Mycolicibacterium bacteremicum]QVI29038.1 mammalian cell entry protein [Mycolicibacterium neoaurum]
MRTRLIQAAAVLFALGLVALAAVAGGLYWDRVQARAAAAAEAELPGLAIQQIPMVFGYDFQTVERSLSEAATLLTPDYRREFEDRATTDIIPQARERQVVSQAHAVGAGMLSAERDSASVLVFMNRTVTDKSKESVYDGSRLKVDYQKIDGRWLISYITPI